MKTEHLTLIGYYNTYIQKYWEDNRKVQTYTELGLSLLLLVVFLAFAIRPTLNTVLELNKKKNEAVEANQRLDEKIQSISLAQANLNEVKLKLGLVEAAVPQEKIVLDFLNQMQLLAGQYNLSLEDLDYSEKSEASQMQVATQQKDKTATISIQPLAFNLSGNGSYGDIKKFVDHLESLPRITQIKSLTLSRVESREEEAEEAQGGLNFKIEGEIYYLPTND